MLPSDEPPDADPHVRWCERGPQQCGPYLDGTPDMGVNLWGAASFWEASPLYEFGTCLKDSIPNVINQDEVLGEGNCGRVTDRGEEACECGRQASKESSLAHVLAKAAG